jgi:uncharacterized protein (TIGR00730 family)
MTPAAPPLSSVGLFCGSSPGGDAAYMEAARAFGRILVTERIKLIYGGGGVGLMGAAARTVVEAGGEVLGVIPQFLCLPEVVYEAAETRVVASMHERKAVMFAQSDGFVVLPGGIGSIEEAVEILSWARLGLHAKPVVFLNLQGFWEPLFDLFEHTQTQGFTPSGFSDAWQAVDTVEDLLPALREMIAAGPPAGLTPLSLV